MSSWRGSTQDPHANKDGPMVTVFGSLCAGISETGTTPREACRVALRFDASVCHSASLETSQTRRQAARLPRPDTLDAATPHHDCRHHDAGVQGKRTPTASCCPEPSTSRFMPPSDSDLARPSAAFARRCSVCPCPSGGQPPCRAVARFPPLGRPHDHGRLVAVGV